MGTRDELLALMKVTAEVKPIKVETKAWGTIYVRPPTVEEVDEATIDDEEKKKEEEEAGKKDRRRFARSAARAICDAEGNRIFDSLNKEDLDLLAAQPWSELQKILAALQTGGDASGN